MKQPERIIFSISGGAGKNITATAVVRALKQEYPKAKMCIHSPYPDVWVNNPNVDHILSQSENPYMYAKDPNTMSCLLEPYLTTDYTYQREHLAVTWGHLYGVEVIDKNPELFLTEQEITRVKNTLQLDGKKIFLIQTSGGAANQAFPISWTRDLPIHIAEKVCKKMIEAGYFPLHIRRADQYAIPGVPALTLPFRELFAVIALSEKRLFIDSMPQHAAAALKKPSVVVWVGNSPVALGEALHTDIISKTEKQFRHYPQSYAERYNITGSPEECPYDTNDLFDANELIKALLG